MPQEAKRVKKEENKAGKQLSVSVTDLWAKKTAWTSDHEKAKEITRAIGLMLASDYLPYNFVEGQGFQALMKLVVPQYHIPSRTTFSRSIVPTMYKNLKREIIYRITTEFVGMPSYCFSTDIWSSRALDSYISFCLIYLTADFQMRSYTLENKPFVAHTGEAILESLEKSIEDWSLPRAVPINVLRDNGSNMSAAMNMSQNFMDLPCFAHTLQLSINDAVSEIEDMVSMIAKCKKIVSHYHHSIQSSQLLYAQQRQLKRAHNECINASESRLLHDSTPYGRESAFISRNRINW